MSLQSVFYFYICDKNLEDNCKVIENFTICSKEALHTFLAMHIMAGKNGTEKHKKKILSLFYGCKLTSLSINKNFAITFPRLIHKNKDTGNASIEFMKDLKDFFENNNIVISDRELPDCKKIDCLTILFTQSARRAIYDPEDRLVCYKDNGIWKLSFVNSTRIYRINFNNIFDDCENIKYSSYENMPIGKVNVNADFQTIFENAVENNIFNLVVDGSNIKIKDWHKSIPNLSVYKQAKKYDFGLLLDNLNCKAYHKQWYLRWDYDTPSDEEPTATDYVNSIYKVFDTANVLTTNRGHAYFIGMTIWDLWTYELSVRLNLKIELLDFEMLKKIYRTGYIHYATLNLAPCTNEEYEKYKRKINYNRKILKKELVSFFKSLDFSKNQYARHCTKIDFDLFNTLGLDKNDFTQGIIPVISKDRFRTLAYKNV